MEKTKYVGGRKRQERDYTKPLSELPPQIIGRRSKTVGEIADEAGRAEQTVRQLIDRLKRQGRIHIKSWQRGLFGGQIAAKYRYGPGKDAKRPAPLSRSELTRRYQQTDKGSRQGIVTCQKRRGLASSFRQRSTRTHSWQHFTGKNMNQQFEILDTKQLLEFIKPISERIYWSVIAKDPRFPKPLMGGNGRKALHSRQAVEEYLKILARDGFIQPDSKAA